MVVLNHCVDECRNKADIIPGHFAVKNFAATITSLVIHPLRINQYHANGNPKNADKFFGDILIIACIEGSLEAVEFLLDKKINPDYGEKKEGTPLMVAIRKSNQPMFDLLLKKGADINFIHLKTGLTPLACAIEKKEDLFVRFRKNPQFA